MASRLGVKKTKNKNKEKKACLRKSAYKKTENQLRLTWKSGCNLTAWTRLAECLNAGLIAKIQLLATLCTQICFEPARGVRGIHSLTALAHFSPWEGVYGGNLLMGGGGEGTCCCCRELERTPVKRNLIRPLKASLKAPANTLFNSRR